MQGWVQHLGGDLTLTRRGKVKQGVLSDFQEVFSAQVLNVLLKKGLGFISYLVYVQTASYNAVQRYLVWLLYG